MIILKDEEICFISCKNIYFFDPNSLQLDRKFENISFNSLNYNNQINDGRLMIGTNNSEISVWEIKRNDWIKINKKNEIIIIGEIFKIILLNNNYFAVNSSNQSIFIIKEKDLNCFEIDYVFLNDDYYDFNHEKFFILNSENRIISYIQKGIISIWNYQTYKKLGRLFIELNENENYQFYSENLINISDDLIGIISYKKVNLININKIEIFSTMISENKLHNFYKFQNEIFLLEQNKIKKLLPK